MRQSYSSTRRRLGFQIAAMVVVWIFKDFFENPSADLCIFVLADHGDSGAKTFTASRS
jgi:hypothetical protein